MRLAAETLQQACLHVEVLELINLLMQVNAAFESHVDDCDVEGFMHALGYTSFASKYHSGEWPGGLLMATVTDLHQNQSARSSVTETGYRKDR